jgi:hypothetical protein
MWPPAASVSGCYSGVAAGFTWCGPCDGEGRVFTGDDVDLDSEGDARDFGHACRVCAGRGVL